MDNRNAVNVSCSETLKLLLISFSGLFKTNYFKTILFVLCSFVATLTQLVSVSALFPVFSIFVNNGGRSTNKISICFYELLEKLHLPVEIYTLLPFFVILVVVSIIVQIMVDFYQGMFLRNLETHISGDLFKNVIGAKWIVLQKISHGDFLNAVSRDSEQIVKVYKFEFAMVMALVHLLFFAAYAAYLDLRLFFVSGLVFFIGVVCFYPLINKNSLYGTRLCEANVLLNEKLLNIARFFKTCKAMSLENNIRGYIKPFLFNRADQYFKLGFVSSVQTKASELLGLLILCCLLYVGFVLLEIKFETLAITLIVFNRMVPQVKTLLSSYHQAVAHLPSLRRVELIKARCNDKSPVDGEQLEAAISEIRMENIGFSYEHGKTLFSNLNFKFNAKQFIAVCGESGVGKTTIIDIISGIIEPDSGTLYINNVPAENYSLASRHKKIGYLSQHSYIFSGTLRENILWGVEKVADENLWEAINGAQLSEMVNEKGFDFVVTESGQNLSGGQKQRIAIARLLLNKYDIILMDEPTSALDPETEAGLISFLNSLKGNFGIVMVTHRDEYIKYADVIINVDKDKNISYISNTGV